MDPFDTDDLSDLTPEEQEEFRLFQAGEWPILPEEDIDPELVERMWSNICLRMGWNKPQ